jgi:hypothetical protein
MANLQKQGFRKNAYKNAYRNAHKNAFKMTKLSTKMSTFTSVLGLASLGGTTQLELCFHKHFPCVFAANFTNVNTPLATTRVSLGQLFYS